MLGLRGVDKFVQDAGWYAAADRYEDFIHRHENQHILLLEHGKANAQSSAMRTVRFRDEIACISR